MKKAIFILIILVGIFNIRSAIAQNGLKGEYFNGQDFDQFIGIKQVENIDFYWNDVAPMPGMNPNVCSVRWTGRLKSPQTGTYEFSARVDDGIRVWVGGVRVINNGNSTMLAIRMVA